MLFIHHSSLFSKQKQKTPPTKEHSYIWSHSHPKTRRKRKAKPMSRVLSARKWMQELTGLLFLSLSIVISDEGIFDSWKFILSVLPPPQKIVCLQSATGIQTHCSTADQKLPLKWFLLRLWILTCLFWFLSYLHCTGWGEKLSHIPCLILCPICT